MIHSKHFIGDKMIVFISWFIALGLVYIVLVKCNLLFH
jgi:hypothetical protein